jgi:catechol 2,3-dioxygenase-like lactoylglutathione lyase family enzyme
LAELAFFVDDVDAVADFWERLLGTAPVHRGEGIAVFLSGGAKVLIHAKGESAPGEPPNEDHVAFRVPDVDATSTDLTARGLEVAFPPRDYAWGRSAYLRDPAGHLVELHADEASGG